MTVLEMNENPVQVLTDATIPITRMNPRSNLVRNANFFIGELRRGGSAGPTPYLLCTRQLQIVLSIISRAVAPSGPAPSRSSSGTVSPRSCSRSY